MKLVVLLLKLIYCPFKLFRVKNKIVYMSRQSNTVSEDFSLLMEAMDSNIEQVALCQKINKTYPLHMLRQMYHFATSKVVIVDGYCIVACVLEHSKRNTVIQIWHAATAIKKFGWQTVGKPSGTKKKTAEIMKMHQGYDYIISPSSITADFYEKAFNVSASKIRLMGMPHFTTLNDFKNKEKMVSKYNSLIEKQNIVYIPTFRKNEKIPYKKLASKIDYKKFNFIVRLHPLYREESDDPNIIMDYDFSTYDWMKMADIIISDYSSLIVEAALLEKKLFFYVYDIDNYQEDPGMNVNAMESVLSKYAFRDAKDLVSALDKPYDMNSLRAFKNKFVEINYEASVRELVQFIEGEVRKR